MATSVYLSLKDGRKIALLENADKARAEALKADLDKWVRSGQTLSVANASGTVEDVTPRGVQTIEMVEAPPRQSDLDIV